MASAGTELRTIHVKKSKKACTESRDVRGYRGRTTKCAGRIVTVRKETDQRDNV